MDALILAGGFGTRLRSTVSDVPKPLAPIAGRPFLAWLVDAIIAQGVTNITLSVHHDWQKICDYFEAHPIKVPLNYAIEEKPLGTGGAMAYAFTRYPSVEPTIVLNGDSFMRVPLRVLMTQHEKSGTKLTMTLRQVASTSRYGTATVEDGVITAFGTGEEGKAGLINAGIYVMNPQIFNACTLPAVFSFEQDFLAPHIDKLKPRSFVVDDYFIDIGVPEDYARACRELPSIIAVP